MKTKIVIIASFLMVCFFSFTSMKALNSTQIFEGIYDGKEDHGYNFIGVDEDDEEYTMTFQAVDKSLLKSFDLHSEKLIGEKFMVTYTISIETETETDEDDYEQDIETYTITALKKM